MLLDKISLNTANICYPNDTRSALNYIKVTQKHTIASNGHILLIVDNQTDLEVTSFPDISKKPVQFGYGHKAVLLPAQTCKEVSKRMPKPKKRQLPVLQTAYLSNGSDQTVELTTTDLETPMTTTIRQPNVNYPDIQKVWPHRNIKAKFSLTVSILQDLLRYVSSTGAEGIEFKVHEPLQAVEFRATGRELNGRKIKGLIMPRKEGR